MDTDNFKRKFKESVQSSFTKGHHSSTLQKYIRDELDVDATSKVHVYGQIAQSIGEVKTDFEWHKVPSLDAEAVKPSRKALQNVISDVNRTLKATESIKLVPKNRPKGKRTTTDRWEYGWEKVPEPVKMKWDAVPDLKSDLSDLDGLSSKLEQYIAKQVRDTPESAVDVVLSYHDIEDIGAIVVKKLQEVGK